MRNIYFCYLVDSRDLSLRISASMVNRELPKSSILSSFGDLEICSRDSRFQPLEPQIKPIQETTKGPSTREKKQKTKSSFLSYFIS